VQVYQCIELYSLILGQICSQAKILPGYTLGIKHQSKFIPVLNTIQTI